MNNTFCLCWAAALLLLTAAGASGAQPAPAAPSPAAASAAQGTTSTISWTDVHVHLVGRTPQDFESAAKQAVARMDALGIGRMIVMPPPFVASGRGPFDGDALLAAIRPYPKRFAFLAGGGSLNVMIQNAAWQSVISDQMRQQFEQKAEELLRQGALGFGEIALHHLSHGIPHPYESVAADHPLLLLLADIAARRGAVLDVHLDVVAKDMPTPLPWSNSPLNPKRLAANMAPFERLLVHNPQAKIVWEHAGSDTLGWWTADLTRALLQNHPNLYVAFRLTPGPGPFPANNPMLPGGQIRPAWLSLMQEFPARFLIGSDSFIAPAGYPESGPLAEMAAKSAAQDASNVLRKFLSAMPPDLARKVGSENAAALFKFRD